MSKDGTENQVVILYFLVSLKYFFESSNSSLFTDINVAPLVCDLSLHIMRDLWQSRIITYNAPISFPSMSRDIALQVSRKIPAEDLLNTIYKEGGDTLIHVSLFDVYQLEDEDDQNKSLAFSLKFQSNIATLTDSEVDKDVENILQSLNKAHGAKQR